MRDLGYMVPDVHAINRCDCSVLAGIEIRDALRRMTIRFVLKVVKLNRPKMYLDLLVAISLPGDLIFLQ